MRAFTQVCVCCCALMLVLAGRANAAGHGGHGGGAHGGGGGHAGHPGAGHQGWGGGHQGWGGYGGYGYRGYSSFYGGLTIGLGTFGYGYPYSSYNFNYVSGPLYPYASNGVWGPYSNYGPLYLPANQLYGPSALPAWSLPEALNAPLNVPFGQAGAANVAPQAVPNNAQPAKPRVPANDEALERAFKFLDFGDQLFAKQKFLESYLRYQSASSAAPDLADAHFRRGFALAALGHYDRATEALRRGITLNREWAKSPFKLDDLYADNRVAKQAHQDQLARLLEKEPENANAMFLLGVMLYFDDQQERSRPFLQKALQLMKAQEAAPPAAVPAERNDRNQPGEPPRDGKGAQPPPRPGDLEI